MVGVLDLDEGQPVDRGYFGFLDDQCSGLSSSLGSFTVETYWLLNWMTYFSLIYDLLPNVK